MLDSPQSCMTCGDEGCTRRSASKPLMTPSSPMTSYVVDEVWPEYKDYLSARITAADQLCAPHPILQRYAWPQISFTQTALLPTLMRHIQMRRVATAPGGVRQQTYFRADDKLAAALGRMIDYRAQHLVIYQNFLPWLHQRGWLGGRSYDVLMTRYPLKILHQKLDAAAEDHPSSASLKDFRAPEAIVDAEWRALSGAQHVITPHTDIAALFSEKSHLLPWHLPAPSPHRPGHRSGTRFAFLGPTIAREGAYIARDFARRLSSPLIVFGDDLESQDFWRGIPIERRAYSSRWLDDIGAIIYPAIAPAQPRRLLQAMQNNVTIYATSAAGLPDSFYRNIIL